MKKIWYIYVGGHLGPFNAEEIFRLYYQHQIDDKTFLWRRGEKDWRRLEDFPEIYNILHPEAAILHPRLTGKPAEDAVRASHFTSSSVDNIGLREENMAFPSPSSSLSSSSSSSSSSSESLEDVEAEIPPLPEFVSAWKEAAPAAVHQGDGGEDKDSFALSVAADVDTSRPAGPPVASRTAIKKFVQDDLEQQVSERFLAEYLAEQDDGSTTIRPVFRVWHYGLVAALLGIAAAVAVIIWPYFGHPISIEADEEFWQVTRTSPAKGSVTTLRVSPNFSEVYLASNMPGDAIVHLILQAKPHQILAVGPIKASAQASYHNGVAVFSTLVMEQGLSLAEGIYEYQVKAARQDPRQRWKWWWKMWQQDQPPVWVGQDDLWAAQGEIYLGHSTDFNLRHAEFLAQQKMAQQTWRNELREQGKTVYGLLGQLKKLGLKEITTWRKASDVAHFVTAYQRQIMPFLQNLVEAKNFHLAGEMSKLEQDLRRIAQRMAAASMDLEAKARQKAKILKADRQQFTAQWQQQMQNLEAAYQTWAQTLQTASE